MNFQRVGRFAFACLIGALFVAGAVSFVSATGSSGGGGLAGGGHYAGPGDVVPGTHYKKPPQEEHCPPALTCLANYDNACPSNVLPLSAISTPAPVKYAGMYTMKSGGTAYWVQQFVVDLQDYIWGLDLFLQANPQYIDANGNVTLALTSGDVTQVQGMAGTWVVPFADNGAVFESDLLNGNLNAASLSPFCIDTILPVAAFSSAASSCSKMNGNAPPNAQAGNGYILNVMPATMAQLPGGCKPLSLRIQVNWQCLRGIISDFWGSYGYVPSQPLFMFQFKTCVSVNDPNAAPGWTAFAPGFPTSELATSGGPGGGVGTLPFEKR